MDRKKSKKNGKIFFDNTKHKTKENSLATEEVEKIITETIEWQVFSTRLIRRHRRDDRASDRERARWLHQLFEKIWTEEVILTE